jgi:hypothetical protein
MAWQLSNEKHSKDHLKKVYQKRSIKLESKYKFNFVQKHFDPIVCCFDFDERQNISSSFSGPLGPTFNKMQLHEFPQTLVLI